MTDDQFKQFMERMDKIVEVMEKSYSFQVKSRCADLTKGLTVGGVMQHDRFWPLLHGDNHQSPMFKNPA